MRRSFIPRKDFLRRDFVPRIDFARRCFEPGGIFPKGLCTRTDFNRRDIVQRDFDPTVKGPEGEKSRR